VTPAERRADGVGWRCVLLMCRSTFKSRRRAEQHQRAAHGLRCAPDKVGKTKIEKNGVIVTKDGLVWPEVKP